MNNPNESNPPADHEPRTGGVSAETRLLCGASHNATLQRQSGCGAGAEPINHVINTSGGVCSFWAGERVVKKHGRDGVVLLFADVMMEDPDLYRFLREGAEYLGVEITRISKDLTPWELFAKQGMIGNSRSPICSVMLKREPLDLWHRENTLEITTTLHIGIDWTEEHRLHHLRRLKPTWRIEAPMCEAPLWDKCRMLDELRAIGIEPPRLYKWGFPHNNCGGFCVKAGHAQFALLLRARPESADVPGSYLWHEEQEQRLRAQVGNFSVMTDRRGDGKKKPLTMRDFRHRIEAGESFDREDWGGCGCALDSGSDGLRDGAEQAGAQASDDSQAKPHNSVICREPEALSPDSPEEPGKKPVGAPLPSLGTSSPARASTAPPKTPPLPPQSPTRGNA